MTDTESYKDFNIKWEKYGKPDYFLLSEWKLFITTIDTIQLIQSSKFMLQKAGLKDNVENSLSMEIQSRTDVPDEMKLEVLLLTGGLHEK